MNNIDWQQKRRVHRDVENEEFYVEVDLGFMLLDDYVEGGPVVPRTMTPCLEFVGQFTNAQISNGDVES